MRAGSDTIFQKDSTKSGTQFTPVQELQAARGQLSYFQWRSLIEFIKVILNVSMQALNMFTLMTTSRGSF